MSRGNVTFTTATFEVSVDEGETSPGQVWIDIDEDGIFEWEFTGTGYGDIGHQNHFYDGSEWFVSPCQHLEIRQYQEC